MDYKLKYQLLSLRVLFHPEQRYWGFQKFQLLGRSLNQLPKSMVVERLFDYLFFSENFRLER